MAPEVSRRDFLSRLGVTVTAAAAGAASGLPVLTRVDRAEAQVKDAGKIPDTPYKIGHMTFFTGPAAVLGEPSYKGHMLAAEEINAQGGLLGKRKIETVKADENAGTDANVKEMRRMKLSEKIDLFTGVISSGNTPALGPVAEELKLLTIFVDGCTDFLFDKAVPNPHYIFRITNIQSADGVTCALAIGADVAQGPQDRPHPPRLLLRPQRLRPRQHRDEEADAGRPGGVRGLAQARDHRLHLAHHQGDRVQAGSARVLGVGRRLRGHVQAGPALRHVQEDEVREHASPSAWPRTRSARTTRRGRSRACTPTTTSTTRRTTAGRSTTQFVKKYYDRWKEYPNFQSEGAYSTLYMLKMAIEKANKLMGGWPDDDTIISQLEGLMHSGPAGYVYIRPDNHQGYKDAMTGFSVNSPDYPFQILDPNRIITIPIRNITAPPGWPKGEPTSTYTWIDKTWPTVNA